MDLCSLSDDMLGGTDDVDFPLRQKALYANWGLREIFREIYQIFGGWTFQDSNVAGEDKVVTDLLNDSTQFYPFPTVSWLSGIGYLDNDDNYFNLTPITLEEIREMGYAEEEFMDTPGRPEYYRPVKNGVKIYPVWDTNEATVTGGLIAKIGAQDISTFTPSSTTAQPGYDSLAGHEAIAIFMAMTKARFDTLDVFAGLRDSWLTAISGVKAHYKKKFMQVKPTIRKGRRGNIADSFVS